MNHLPEKKSAVRIVDHELGVVDVVRKRHIIASHALLFLIREVYMLYVTLIIALACVILII